MSAQDRLRESLDQIFTRGEVYVTVDDGDICIDGTMKLDQFQRLTKALGVYFEESNACPF